MIFVTVGSQKFQFNRLLKAIDDLVANGDITEKVFAQSGACSYIPQNYSSEAFIDRDKFTSLMNQSDLVITHGGTGAIIGALKAGKKVIAVPRLAKYGEHVDDHQRQLIDEFSKSNFISSCEDMSQLGMLIKETEEKVFEKYVSNTKKYLKVLEDYINNL